MALAGLVGGVIGYALSTNVDEPILTLDMSEYRRQAALYFMLVTASIGIAIIAMDRWGSHQPLISSGDLKVVGTLVGLGLAAGYIGQVIFDSILSPTERLQCFIGFECVTWQLRLARTIGWGVAGLGCGAGVGLAFASRQRLKNAMGGGLVGGLIGGLLFDFVFEIVGYEDLSTSRMIAISVIGLLIGSAIGTADRLRPDDSHVNAVSSNGASPASLHRGLKPPTTPPGSAFGSTGQRLPPPPPPRRPPS